MPRNERTSKPIATVAAKILHIGYAPTRTELRAMAGSLLTQSPDKTDIVAHVKAKAKTAKTKKRR